MDKFASHDGDYIELTTLSVCLSYIFSDKKDKILVNLESVCFGMFTCDIVTLKTRSFSV